MVQAKSKKLLWRVNRGMVRDLLPHEPLDVHIDLWWVGWRVGRGAGGWRVAW